jgi:hypothetical protein
MIGHFFCLLSPLGCVRAFWDVTVSGILWGRFGYGSLLSAFIDTVRQVLAAFGSPCFIGSIRLFRSGPQALPGPHRSSAP